MLPDWRNYSASPDTGLTSIVIFSDFKCRSCKYAHEVLKGLSDARAAGVAVRWWQLPLLGPVSIEGARAIACLSSARDQAALTDVIFAASDSLGIESWTKLAERSGISAARELQSCVESEDSLAALTEAKAIAVQLGITSTPSVLLDSLLFRGMPSRNYLNRYLDQNSPRRLRPH